MRPTAPAGGALRRYKGSGPYSNRTQGCAYIKRLPRAWMAADSSGGSDMNMRIMGATW